MTQMNPFVKSVLVFVILFAAGMVASVVFDSLASQGSLRLDLSQVLGVSAGGAVIVLVRDLTKEDD